MYALELVLSWATLHFAGWVEPAPGFVGFRCTQPKFLDRGPAAKKSHFVAIIAQSPAVGISKLKSHKSR